MPGRWGLLKSELSSFLFQEMTLVVIPWTRMHPQKTKGGPWMTMAVKVADRPMVAVHLVTEMLVGLTRIPSHPARREVTSRREREEMAGRAVAESDDARIRRIPATTILYGSPARTKCTSRFKTVCSGDRETPKEGAMGCIG